MRTTPFRKVFDKTVRLTGRDPRKNVPSDMRDAVVDHINDRVRTIWQGWRWPEWERTEERAFRTVWNSTRQFLRVSLVDGNPDEVYYLPGNQYYRVLSTAGSDPPVGTLPTDEDFWEVITPLDTFIAYDQVCKRSIGMMLGVFRSNPGTCDCHSRGMRYKPSERGIDVCCGGGGTVFITYKMPVPEFTMLPWVAGKTYVRSEIVFDPSTGECFQAVDTTTNVVTNADDWNWIPFLTTWSDYVQKGAFADSLMEFDQGGNGDLQAKMVLNQYWNQQADDSLQSEVDALVTQGQKLQWNFCRKSDVCESLPWIGGDVETLTDLAEEIITDEVPVGLIDDANTSFTTAFTFSVLWVYLNGQRMIRDVDYTIVGTSGFTMATAPMTGDTLTVDYIRT